MLAPGALKIVIRAAAEPVAGYHDISIEWSDAGTHETLGVVAMPIRPPSLATADIERVVTEVRNLLEYVISPF